MRFCIMRAIPLLAGFLLDAVLGDPYSLPHPIRLIGSLISCLEKWVRKQFPDHMTAGGVLLGLAVMGISTGTSAACLFLAYRIHVIAGLAAESILCYYMLAARCLQKESMKVYAALKKEDVEGARAAVSMIVGRDTKVLDRQGITKAAVETVAENTSDGVTAPIFYMMLFGAAGGVFYKSVNTMDSMIGYKDNRYLELGHFAAKTDDLLNYLPSRITALVMIAAAYLLKYSGKDAYRIWKRDRRKHASPNSAQTEAVCAGALRVRLAGDAWYFGKLHKKPFIGDDIRPVEDRDIVRANCLMYLTSAMMLAAALVIRMCFGLF